MKHFYLRQECSLFTLLPGFPATLPRNHNHSQLGDSTPADGAVKGFLWLGYIGPHSGRLLSVPYDSGTWNVVLAQCDAVPDAPACSPELI